MSETDTPKQLLHLVFGGELESPDGLTFRDLDELDIVGIYPNLCRGKQSLEGQGPGHG